MSLGRSGLFFRDRILLWSCCAAQAGLKLMIFPSQPRKYWDYRHVLPYVASACGSFNVLLIQLVNTETICMYVGQEIES
jgi:hypothetical protein